MQPHRQRGAESGFDLRRPAGAEVPTFLTPGTGFVENCFSLDWWRGAAGATGAGRPVQAVMGPWGAADDVFLARSWLTSCSAAQFLMGQTDSDPLPRGRGPLC